MKLQWQGVKTPSFMYKTNYVHFLNCEESSIQVNRKLQALHEGVAFVIACENADPFV